VKGMGVQSQSQGALVSWLTNAGGQSVPEELKAVLTECNSKAREEVEAIRPARNTGVTGPGTYIDAAGRRHTVYEVLGSAVMTSEDCADFVPLAFTRTWQRVLPETEAVS